MLSVKTLLTAGGLLAFAAVAMGAFGAHMLKSTLETFDTVKVWDTAVRFQMWHALALVLVSQISIHCTIARQLPYLLIAGILLFSGSLYWLALDGPRWLGPITPIGGILLLSSWLVLAFGTKTPITNSSDPADSYKH